MQTNRVPEQYFDETSQRYFLIHRILEKSRDERGLSLLEHLVRSSQEYLGVYSAAINSSLGLAAYCDGSSSRTEAETRDHRRMYAHNTFMSNLAAFQRYFRRNYAGLIKNGEIPQTGIYTGAYVVGEPDDERYRAVMRDWAIAFATRVEEVKKMQ